MTRSLLSTSFLLVALGSVLAACGGGGTGSSSGGSSGTSGSAGTAGTTGGTAGKGGSAGTTGGAGTAGNGGSAGTTGGAGTGGTGGTTGGAGGTTGGTGGIMCHPDGDACNAAGDCCSSTCVNNKCGCLLDGTACAGASDCCAGVCTNGLCGMPPVEDADGDGWKVSDGDCCDSKFDACSDKPELVNPGALEYPGNGVDDDCNPLALDTDPYPTCGTKAQADQDIANQAIQSSTKVVKAMDLCVFTQESPPLPQKTWGVITSNLTLADGTGTPKNIQVGVLPDFGPNVLPQYGETMAALSSGTARRSNYPSASDPGYVHPQNGTMAGQDTGNYNAMTQTPAPPSYVAANNGVLPSPCGNCTGPNCTTAYDSVRLTIRIRPPTNAKSFSYRFNFFSAEYPEFLCQDFNDFFVALINGNNLDPAIPADHNIAFDPTYNPISVNNQFFQVCFPAVGSPPGSCSGGTLELIGNGMGGWGASITDGGATGWLQNDVPLALKQNPNNPNDPTDLIPTADPFDLELVIWDAGDHNVDSLVLLDRFRWNLDFASLSTHH